jgi:cytochrome c biogenesis protein CcmG, thiol:disulfide interchange protein DsbE
MARRLRLFAGTLTLAAAIAAFVVFGLASHPASGRPAPALPREHLAGAQVTLASLLKGTGGRPALVVFWASWCGPCAKEAPALERFSQSAVGQGRIVGVDWSDAKTGAREFIKHYGWTFPNVRDAEGTVGNSYRLAVLPTTFVINAHGRISKVLRGPQNERSLQVALATVEHS